MKEQGPRILVLKTDGINCDNEMVDAFQTAGGRPRATHVNELRNREVILRDFQILAIPGGFSYGDDVRSGKILALELNSYLGDQINDFVQQQKGLVLGVCNGFQVLTRTGLLPFGAMGEMQAILANNNSGKFECRQVNLGVETDSAWVVAEGMKGPISLPIAHGEGKFFALPQTLQGIKDKKLVVMRYVNDIGMSTQEYPANPNGSLNAIAAICDSSGRIMGMMPHPERFVRKTQHPNWRRMPDLEPQGLQIFEKMIAYAKQM